jgi:hypothetical protein
MRIVGPCLCVAMLAACHPQKPKMTDAQVAAMRASDPGMTDACLEKLRWGGVEAMPQRTDQCYKFDKARRWKGHWINQFEGSIFCPAGSPCPDERSGAANAIWLEFSSTRPVQNELKPGGVYEVEFIGRRSIGEGHFGHMGMSPNDIIVDRMISMNQIEPPPPEPTKEQVIAEWKKCEAEKSCIPNWQVINSMDE